MRTFVAAGASHRDSSRGRNGRKPVAVRLSRFAVRHDEPNRTVLYSGLSGAALELTPSDADLLVGSARIAELPSRLLDELRRWYVVVEDDFDEIELLRRRYDAGRTDETNLGLTVITSLGCNFDCPYCYEAKHPSVLGDEVDAKLMSFVEGRMVELRSLQIHWLGGEPLIAHRRLFDMSSRMKSLAAQHNVAYASNVTTNGWLLTRKRAIAALEAGISHAQICLDGPPEVHNRMRPLRSGSGTFDRILANVCDVADVLDVTIRVNADSTNYDSCGELLGILRDAGLAGRVTVYLGQLVQVNDGAPIPTPSSSYVPRCFGAGEFAEKEAAFMEQAAQHGFNGPALPGPITTPCTAVRPGEYVVGSAGELYKCWENVGNSNEIVGHLSDIREAEEASSKWLAFSPFEDAECRGCIALPSCMGGCRHHQLDPDLADSRCSTFRRNHDRQLALFASQTSCGIKAA